MNTEKESDLFNEAFTDPFLYIYKSQFNYCIVHFVSKSPFLIKTLESSDNLGKILQLIADHGKRMGVPFVKNTVYE
jgi:hypothetical protein